MKNLGIILTFLALSTSVAIAQGSKSTGAGTSSEVTLDGFRCEKTTNISLAEFKAKLVENCDLNKPFSANHSNVLNDSSYFYCCQKKK